MSEPHVKVEKLVKIYGDRTVLHGVDITIDRAETLVIIGGSGAGKSTLVRHLIALERPTSGRIVVDGDGHLVALRRAAQQGAPALRDGLSEVRALRLDDGLRQRGLSPAGADEALGEGDPREAR
jgi:ABC-type polar amino acid transport system ATPase subunit